MNNRPIKFRVWNQNAKGWVLNNGNGEKFGVFGLLNTLTNSFGEDGLVYQQYTGLKDSTDKEIYEGDILEFSNLNYEVMWIDYEWIATCPNYRRHHWPRFESFGRKARLSKIIGNIFETPELLA